MTKTACFYVTGSAGAVVFPTYYLQIRQLLPGWSITLMVSASAEQFLPIGSLEWLAETVLYDSKPYNPLGIVREVDHVMVLPASANVIVSSSLGLAYNPGLTVLAGMGNRVTYLPAMPSEFWDASATKTAVENLRRAGRRVVEPTFTQSFELYNRTFDDFYNLAEPPIVANLAHTIFEDGFIK